MAQDVPAAPWWRAPGVQLAGLLLLAAILRAIAAFQPGFHHPDAIYQYLEPAHRLLTGSGARTWEWRVGMRSWLLPTLLAGPLAVGEALGGTWVMALPKLAMGAASLSIVWSAWALGRRVSPLAGLLAGFVAATWFEGIHFGVQTLAEPAATAAILPAAVLVTAPRPGRYGAALAGALLAFAVLMRPHYAPAAAALVIVAWWPLGDTRAPRGRWAALVAGAAAVAAIGGLVDVIHGALPFAWIVENIRQNIVGGVAARFGVSPPFAYLGWLLDVWSVWTIPILIGLRYGWRASPALLAAALAVLLVHMLIGHKEYRFVYGAIVAIPIVAAIGWGALLPRLTPRLDAARRRRVTVAVFVAWGLASLLLATGPRAQGMRRQGVPGSRMFAALRADPQACGVALVYGASYADVPGTVALRRDTPLALFWIRDPATHGADPWRTMAANAAGFNRIVDSVPHTGRPPAGYRTVMCEGPSTVIGQCLYARPGGCADTRASPFLIDSTLARLGF